ncbi:MAG: hypothetical protein ACOYU7_02355 [Bacillota bacterium]
MTWLLLRVIPLRLSTFFLYKSGTAIAASIILSLLAAVVFGQPVVGPGLFLLSVTAVSFTTPLVALLLGALAGNKIEGLALGKILGFALVTPVVVFFVPPAWQLLLAWNPWYWGYLGLLQAYAGNALLSALPLHWPGYPSQLLWLMPLLLGLLGTAVFARIYRLRVE